MTRLKPNSVVAAWCLAMTMTAAPGASAEGSPTRGDKRPVYACTSQEQPSFAAFKVMDSDDGALLGTWPAGLGGDVQTDLTFDCAETPTTVGVEDADPLEHGFVLEWRCVDRQRPSRVVLAWRNDHPTPAIRAVFGTQFVELLDQDYRAALPCVTLDALGRGHFRSRMRHRN